ncbi:hypothetical protein D9M71_365590 [compost metagenome]
MQAQRLLPVTGTNAPGEFGHDLQMTGDQAIEQARQGHRQATEKHTHPQQAGQPGGKQTPMHRAQIDAHLKLTEMAQRP